MKIRVVFAMLAILALGAGATAFIFIATEARPSAPTRTAAPAAAAVVAAEAEAPPAPVAALPTQVQEALSPPNATAPRAPPAEMAPGDPPIVEVGPSQLADLPADPEARAAAILEARRRRFSGAMEFLNRRNAERAGLPTPPLAPAVPPRTGAAMSRRGSLSGAMPAVPRDGEARQLAPTGPPAR
jgi:hypothetical protein